MAVFSNGGKLWLLLVTAVVMVPSQAQAQIVPDDTLGAESSSLVLEQLVRGETADLIDGGALRDSNLFHSFGEFNVADGQRVYFANPADVESILSRVTGENPSEIFGTLGVDGAASLFLINPNGLIFGENARLDIEGSFYGTTADGVGVGGEVFSAVAPDQRGLLSVDPSTVFWNYLTAGEIVSRGALSAGGDLVLAGQNLDLQHQVAALGDVSLLATEGIRIRDTAEVPFVALAGETLLVQGNQQVDIVALSHPDSGLFSYGDMVLRSAERVEGDAHYLSGGDFRVEQLDGLAGELYSPIDPIIRSQGDVSFSAYLGASLHILAGGAVDIGTVVITGPDLTGTAISPVTTPELAPVELSDGTTLVIDGSVRPTLDIRAGVDPAVIGVPLGTLGELSGTFFDSSFTPISSISNNLIVTSANITIGDVAINVPNGLVLLTSQYEPATNALTGDILINGTGLLPRNGINVRNAAGLGGAVYLDARNNIGVLNSSIDTTAKTDVQDIVLVADGTVTFDGIDGTHPTGAFSNLPAGETGSAGNIRITATGLNVLNGAQLNSLVFGNGQGGDIILNILETARFGGSNAVDSSASGALSRIWPDGSGTGGDIRIEARNLEVVDGAVLSASNFGTGSAGSVILNILETARFEGIDSTDGSVSGAFSSIELNGEGTGGDVRIEARSLEILDGAQISASTFGKGNAGSIILLIEETVRFEGIDSRDSAGSGAFSSVGLDGKGMGSDIRIQARNLDVLGGAGLVANTSGTGDAGNIILLIEETARFEGRNPRNSSRPSGTFSGVQSTGEGTGGDVRIQARNLEVLDGAELSAATSGIGDAGSVILLIDETARFARVASRDGIGGAASSSVQPTGEGAGGDVRIQARNLEVLDGGQLNASTFGDGDAGSVILLIDETARFEGTDSRNSSIPSGAFSNVAPNGEGTGGDVRIQARNLEVLNGAQLNANTSGTGTAGNVLLAVRNSLTARNGTITTNAEQNSGGQIQIDAGNIFLFGDSDIQTFVNSGENDGGDITISANALVALDDSDILAFAADGRGGDVDLSETAFLGQNFQFAPRGTDPRTLDNNDRVDINATGGIASGTVLLADVSFIEDSLNELPDNLVNSETLVANSCIARNNDTDSSLTITGSGGLGVLPGESPDTYSLGTVQSIPDGMESATIAEPQGTYRLTDGRLVLGRECNTHE